MCFPFGSGPCRASVFDASAFGAGHHYGWQPQPVQDSLILGGKVETDSVDFHSEDHKPDSAGIRSVLPARGILIRRLHWAKTRAEMDHGQGSAISLCFVYGSSTQRRFPGCRNGSSIQGMGMVTGACFGPEASFGQTQAVVAATLPESIYFGINPEEDAITKRKPQVLRNVDIAPCPLHRGIRLRAWGGIGARAHPPRLHPHGSDVAAGTSTGSNGRIIHCGISPSMPST